MTAGGFVVPEDYLKIAHGYATTSHSSQGVTANFAVVFSASFDQERAEIDAIASAGKLAEAVGTAEGPFDQPDTGLEQRGFRLLRLLERSARLNDENGGGSLTALPISLTLERSRRGADPGESVGKDPEQSAIGERPCAWTRNENPSPMTNKVPV